MLAQHSSEHVEHYTPTEVIEAARALLGRIDLDPASCEEANRSVKAVCYYTETINGLVPTWHGNIFLNPPGGKTKNRSNSVLWWEKLCRDYVTGTVRRAIFVGFNMEILLTSQASPLWVGEFPMCIPQRRLKFSGGSPTHGNVIVSLGNDVAQFKRLFLPIGKVIVP